MAAGARAGLRAVSTGPQRAMVLAAGLGLRMRAADPTRPKPLVPLGGRPLMAHALAGLKAAGVREVVVNTHYRAAQIEAFLAAWAAAPGAPRVHVSREEARLETGGGVRRALDRLGAGPFYVVNSDVVIVDAGAPALSRLAAAWDGGAMDALLLVCPAVRMRGHDGAGDFFLTDDRRLKRRGDAAAAPYVFTGAQILHPRLFTDAPDGAYSLNRHYDEAVARGRLFGLAHRGSAIHVGSPAGLAAGAAHFAGRA